MATTKPDATMMDIASQAEAEAATGAGKDQSDEQNGTGKEDGRRCAG